LEILKKYIDVDYLCDISENRWNDLKGYIEDERMRKRAKHAITENERVKRAVEALKGDDIGQLGKLMYQSHLSLKEDYEVSVEGLDLLVDLAKSYPGVWGSRLTGAGFGGCTISIVDNDRVEGFVKYIEGNYRQRTGIVAECYVTKVSEGVREVK
jgi:galactokinase